MPTKARLFSIAVCSVPGLQALADGRTIVLLCRAEPVTALLQGTLGLRLNPIALQATLVEDTTCVSAFGDPCGTDNADVLSISGVTGA